MGRKHKNRNKNKKNVVVSVQQSTQTSVQNKTSSSSIVVSDAFKKYMSDIKQSTPKSFGGKMLFWLKEKQVLSKIFVLCFALGIFSYAYFNVGELNRSVLTYMGLMLTMVVAYIEILIIRDHLWVIEGSMPESKRWREVFFNPTSLRKQKFRKIIVLLFALIVFVYIYRRNLLHGAENRISFMGLILMITMVYYEILSIRDEVSTIIEAMKQLVMEKVFEESKDK